MFTEQCQICLSKKLSPFLQVKNYAILSCGHCSHIQVSPIPDEEELKVLYQHVSDDSFYANGCSISLEEIEQNHTGFLQKYFSERLDVIRNLKLRHDSKILDFGCTNGTFVKAMNDFGYQDAFGYDITEDLVYEGQKKGLNLFTGELKKFVNRRQKTFDLVISYNVFEHLPHPQETITTLKKLLKPGGYFIISIPHVNSLQARLFKEKSPIIDPPFHIHYFTKKSMTLFFQTNGFKVINIKTPFWGKEADTYLILKGYNKFFAMALRYIASPLRFLIMKFYLGGTMLTVARIN